MKSTGCLLTNSGAEEEKMIGILRVKGAVHYKSEGKKTSSFGHSNKATEKY